MKQIAILGFLFSVCLAVASPAWAGTWIYEEYSDPFTDKSSAIVVSSGEEGSAVSVKCQNKEDVFVIFSFNYIDFELNKIVEVKTRINKDSPRTYSTFFVNDLYALFEPDSLALARELVKAETFAASNGDDTRVFELSGGSKIVDVLHFCGHTSDKIE